jgi:platelet-activating factor acetylhydrolase IB subunit beta/gamma
MLKIDGFRFTKDTCRKLRRKSQKVRKHVFSIFVKCKKNYFCFVVIFFGDDILEGLMFTEIYKSFEELHLLNFSIKGDKVENVLYRIPEVLKEIKPKIVILNVGTNNTPHNSADEISEGILECLKAIRKEYDGFIIVLNLLPRGYAHNVLREKIEEINILIQKSIQGMNKVQLIDITKGLIQSDGTISHHDMYDYFLLTNAASKRVFEPVLDLLNQILNENEKEVLLTPSE